MKKNVENVEIQRFLERIFEDIFGVNGIVSRGSGIGLLVWRG